MRRTGSAGVDRPRVKSREGPIGVSSIRGIRVPELSMRRVYVLRWILGSAFSSSSPAEREGAREIEITSSSPFKQIDSITSALKNDIKSDLSCIKRGWESNSGEAK